MFQSTRPRRGATYITGRLNWNKHVSIHAPPKGRDALIRSVSRIILSFQSTRPRRGGLESCGKTPPRLNRFNPRAPRRGATRWLSRLPSRLMRFNPRAPKGRDVSKFKRNALKTCFNPRAPRRGATLTLICRT